MDDQNYRTADMYYAAYLRVAGCNLKDTVKEQHGAQKRVYFLFENNPNMRDLKVQYFNRTAKVPALQYADEVRSMKALTHEVLNGP